VVIDVAAAADRSGPADLERVVREYLDPRRLAWFVVAPKSDPAGAGKTP